jgi:hypothetical protein
VLDGGTLFQLPTNDGDNNQSFEFNLPLDTSSGTMTSFELPE